MAELKKRILVVDDDQRLRELVVKYLSEQGFEARAVSDASGMDKQLARERYDLIVLDLMLPGEDGLAICRRLRGGNAAPGSGPAIVMLTAKGDDVDRIVGLEMGADDYLPKPFNPRELVARIRAILRSREFGGTTRRQALTLGPLFLDPQSFVVSLENCEIRLTSAEFFVLEALVRRAGQVQSRAVLTERALGRALEPYDRSIDTHVANIRRKLGLVDESNIAIRSVRGQGYLLSCTGLR
jgi:two-component system phosphate regulon response regulator OmpR